MEDIALIENLEETKRTAIDIAEKVMQANDTSFKLSKAREVYRPVATRGALMYFLVDALSALDRVYHYTMATFVSIMVKGAQRVLLQPIDFIGSLLEQKPHNTVLCAP